MDEELEEDSEELEQLEDDSEDDYEPLPQCDREMKLEEGRSLTLYASRAFGEIPSSGAKNES